MEKKLSAYEAPKAEIVTLSKEFLTDTPGDSTNPLTLKPDEFE